MTVNKYSNTYQRPTKMKPVDVKSNTTLTLVKKLMIKILKLKLEILLGYNNIKYFLEKAMFQIDLKMF